MTPNLPGQQQPSLIDKLMSFIFGRGALGQAANPGGTPPFLPQQNQQSQLPGVSQNNTMMQQVVDNYMKQKALQDAAKKKKKPTLDE